MGVSGGEMDVSRRKWELAGGNWGSGRTLELTRGNGG